MESTFASVQDVCSALNDQATLQNASAALLKEQKRIVLMQLKVQPNNAGLIPSGPRKRGEGCDDENQGIVAAEETSSGGARLRVTLLAAGFVIGPGGSSIRAISQKSGADIRSWNDSLAAAGRTRRVRTIVIEGKNHRSVVLALAILCEAIELYKELCGGNYCGKYVERCQYIRGVEFVYSPPPRSAVPYAAALKPENGSGSPACDDQGTAASLNVYSSPSSGGEPTLDNTLLSACKMYTNSAAQNEDQSIHAVHPLAGTATAAAATPSSLAAALAGSSPLSLLPQAGNMNSMAPGTPLVPHKMYDTANEITAPGTAEDTIVSNNNFTSTTAATPVQLSTPEFFKLFSSQHATSDLDMCSHQQAHFSPETEVSELVKDVPCYSLFGPDANAYPFGPNLLCDIWGPDGNGPGLPPIPIWRGYAPVAVSDDQLNMIGLPSYEDFAEQSPYYSAKSNSLRNVLKPSEMPSLRLNTNGFLFSAYEDNSSASPVPILSSHNNNNNPSGPGFTAGMSNQYAYYNANTSATQDQVMYDAQQYN